MKRTTLFRIIIYILALLILSMGLTLNTKAGLGVSAIISVSYCISIISGINFGNVTLGLYTLFVIMEIILHMLRYKREAKEHGDTLGHAIRKDLPLILLMDLLQIPLSIVFTRFLNVFSAIVPDAPSNFGIRFLVLLLAILLTGIGAAMSLDMRIVPNPGDGIVQAIADFIKKPIGITKNGFDLLNICISFTIGMIFTGKLTAVGIGTVMAVIFVGRVIAVFNGLFLKKLQYITGLEE